MPILTFYMVMTTFLFANLEENIHKLKTIKNTKEKQFEQQIYWKKYLKNKEVKYGYYETIKYLIFVTKDTKELKVLKKIDNKFFQIKKNDIIIGEKLGDKKIEGDKKTPEGAYDLVSKLTKLDPFYGPLALVTSYPNTFDKILHKKGHGIWIHGMPINGVRQDYTKGCIALDNKELKKLDKNIILKNSIVIISKSKIKNITKDNISLILSSIYKWKNALENSHFNEYLSFYSKDFQKYNGYNLEKFTKYIKKRFFKKRSQNTIFSNIDIIPYPNSLNKKMYEILINEIYTLKDNKLHNKKELFIEIKDNKMKILAET